MFFEELYEQHAPSASDPKRLDQTWCLITLLRVTLAVTVIVTVCTWLLPDVIFGLLVGPRYRNISGLLPRMVLSGGLFACGQAASQWVMVASKISLLLIPRIVTFRW